MYKEKALVFYSEADCGGGGGGVLVVGEDLSSFGDALMAENRIRIFQG
jgi:hypothetical protein